MSRDPKGGVAGASVVEWVHQPVDVAVRLHSPAARSVSSGAAIDLDDINDARSLAVLSVQPHSRVLDVGSGSGVVARALTSRGCHVWGIDVDSAAIRLAEPWCDFTLLGDVETADLAAFLGPQRADAILFLDVLEHLRDPAAAIRRAVPLLAPGGKIVLSVPHVAHAAVRLQLLAGALPRTSEGLLDRRPLHFFDRPSLDDLLRRAGVRVIDEARVVRSLQESEIAPSLDVFPREAIDLATAGPDADTYRFVVTVVPNAADTSVERMPMLASVLTAHLHRVERENRRIEERARGLDSQVDEHQREHDRLGKVLEEARLARRQSEEQLARTTAELERCQLERRFLRDDVLVKDAYLSKLREQAAQRQQAHADLQATQRQQFHADVAALTERLDDSASKHTAEMKRATDLALSNRELREKLERAQQELQRVHASVAATLAQPRYVVADRFNAWARKAMYLHSTLKHVWAWYRGQ